MPTPLPRVVIPRLKLIPSPGNLRSRAEPWNWMAWTRAPAQPNHLTRNKELQNEQKVVDKFMGDQSQKSSG